MKTDRSHLVPDSATIKERRYACWAALLQRSGDPTAAATPIARIGHIVVFEVSEVRQRCYAKFFLFGIIKQLSYCHLVAAADSSEMMQASFKPLALIIGLRKTCSASGQALLPD